MCAERNFHPYTCLIRFHNSGKIYTLVIFPNTNEFEYIKAFIKRTKNLLKIGEVQEINLKCNQKSLCILLIPETQDFDMEFVVY
jgi:hypothetical protein